MWRTVSIPRSGFCSFKLQVYGSGALNVRVSIPRSGFCSFKLYHCRRQWCLNGVSIPRSGFCSFKPTPISLPISNLACFNPSVGILFIQAPVLSTVDTAIKGFQSLGRDSVHSSWTSQLSKDFNGQFQSLGRDSVHSSGARYRDDRICLPVSIPRSGFCSFKRQSN